MNQTSPPITKHHHAAPSFTVFKNLPPELRIMIWQLAMPESRTVVLTSSCTRQRREAASLDAILPTPCESGEDAWYSTAQIPALLHVNQEARYEALMRYTLSFDISGPESKSQPKVYFDFSRDTLFFPEEELKVECKTLWARTCDLEKVKRLAIVPEGAFRALQWTKTGLRSLCKLTFVHGTEEMTHRLGILPHLLEDADPQPPESPWWTDDNNNKTPPPAEDEEKNPARKRIKDARDELNALLSVLSIEWEELPVLSTAVFRQD
ncbi:hypothetical protein F5Y17DRAFT_459511 [Xylariaceae sp. FL0594]|nr:hypothetical protein F5Y17DRAFT_459511 [Xylariaceae sp. FL0594]